MRAYTPTKLTDKFFLGGGTSLRGFGLWGVGPRQNGTAVQIKIVETMSVSFPLISYHELSIPLIFSMHESLSH